MIQLQREELYDLPRTLSREWLETNGIGGYASSTAAGINTRRYHGLLVAATKPPLGRAILLAKLEEALIVNGQRFDLSANQYPGVIHPPGHRYQTGFRLDPFPVFTFEIAGLLIEKSLFMPHGENTVVIQYDFRLPDSKRQKTADERLSDLEASSFGLPPSSLLLRPLVAFRDYHSLARENGALDFRLATTETSLVIKPYEDLPALHFAHDDGEAELTGYWYRNFEYAAERERGFDFTEDLYSPFELRFDLRGRARVSLIVSTEARDIARADEYRRAEIERRSALVAGVSIEDEFKRALVAAADQFIVAWGEQKTIIAGYHWFSDWGRDTMIALPGLTLATGRFDDARRILAAFAHHVNRGMLPNRFPDLGEVPEYNTVDATLWHFEAARAYVSYTGDYDFIRGQLYDVLADIITWHLRGTRYGIRVDTDGLLAAGEEGAQLTWMDAKVGDRVVTPRAGKPVEIQALWYNALRSMEDFARRFQDEARADEYAALAAQARASFNELFWNEEAQCLYDVVDGNERDASLRPNQIFAVSLPHTMLTWERARRVIAIVERELLTPYGLRSLAPSDPRYRGRYEGDAQSRDSVYHQGTVWAWLLGPFITAYLRVCGESLPARAQATQWLEGLREHLGVAGLGQVSEIFDADAPHTPRGCIAQAWSVAEALRALTLVKGHSQLTFCKDTADCHAT